MKTTYENYIFLKGKIITEWKVEISDGVNKARNQNTFYSKYHDTLRRELKETQQLLTSKNLTRFFFEMEELLELDSLLEEEDAFNQCLSEKKIHSKTTIQILAKSSALNEISDFIYKNWIGNQEIETIEKLHWGGSEQTEFIQLIYALIESGYITEVDKKIGKYTTVERISNFFDFPLSKNWRDDLSSSIHDRNSDYQPEIFTNILRGWQKYRDTQIIKKKKRILPPKNDTTG